MAKKKRNLKSREELFSISYAKKPNATQAYLSVDDTVTKQSAGELGYRMLKKVEVRERIKELRNEYAIAAKQTKTKTIEDLIETAELARQDGQYSAYAKLRDMVIKMCGHYEPEKIEVKAVTWQVGFGGAKEKGVG